MSDLLLLVEDDEAISWMFATALRQAGWQVEIARDGEAGLDAARRSEPAAVLLDMALPKMNGAEVLEALRVDSRTRHLPVIVLSNSELRDWQRAAQRLGGRWIIKSSVLPLELAEVVADEVGPPGERRRTPRRLADVLGLLESAKQLPGGQLPASIAGQLLACGIDLEPHASLDELRSKVAAMVARATPTAERRQGDRRRLRDASGSP